MLISYGVRFHAKTFRSLAVEQGLKVTAGRAPTVIALENVAGTLTSHKGTDFTAICEALDNLGYRYGAFIFDASHFVPQSRPRLFVIAVEKGADVVKAGTEPMAPWHTAALKGLRSHKNKRRKGGFG